MVSIFSLVQIHAGRGTILSDESLSLPEKTRLAKAAGFNPQNRNNKRSNEEPGRARRQICARER
jgi:hypothetical protein